MKGSKACFILTVVVACVLSWVSLPCAQKEPEKIKVNVEMKTGDEVSLFYGGTGKIRQLFPVGTTMSVYERNRAFGFNANMRIGKIKVVSHESENFVKAQVIEGVVRPGSVVKLKPGARQACMVTPPASE